jgi:hypothetical protein
VIGLEHVLDNRFQTRGPLGDTEDSPVGARQYWEMTSGTLSGEGLSGDRRSRWRLDDGLIRSLPPSRRPRPIAERRRGAHPDALQGLVERSDAFLAAAEADRQTEWADQYMRFATRFETGAERYRWLNESLF